MTVSALEHVPSRTRRRSETTRLFAELARETDHQRRKDLLDQVILVNLGVAQAIARQFRGRGLHDDDLEQVAYLALTRAAQKFDLGQERDFLTYAVPTISGELKRHFRDLGWVIRPPRRIQEIQSRVIHAYRAGREAGEPPSVARLAKQLDLPTEDVQECLTADGCFAPLSLDRPVLEAVGDGPDGTSLGVTLPADDEAERRALEARTLLGPALATLSAPDARMLVLRFVHERTQPEIAEELGLSQMQVSRRLRRILARLATEIGTDDAIA